MTKKNVKAEPANLSEKQKEDIKVQILKQFPNLSLFNDELDFLIEQYNKDKKYVAKLMDCKNPIEKVVDENKIEAIKVVKQGTDEWNEIDAKMRKAREEFLKVNEQIKEDNDNFQKSVISI